jgi:hypothetical protein
VSMLWLATAAAEPGWATFYGPPVAPVQPLARPRQRGENPLKPFSRVTGWREARR